MKSYRRMTYTERLTIEKLYNSGASYRAIADCLRRSVSTIHREVKRGLYDHLDGQTWRMEKYYSAQIAHEDAEYNFSAHGRPLAIGCNHAYANAISARIQHGESPDSICGSLRREKAWTVSTSTLYRYISKGYIPNVTNADLLAPRRKRRYRKVRTAKRAPVGISIELRPYEVSARHSFGHWEMDCVVGKSKGKSQSLLVLTERLTRFEMIFKLPQKTAANVNCIVEATLSKFPQGTFRSITVDNGSEFSSAHLLPLPVYYCHPFCSSERGSNENANKIIRRYFPKGQSLHTVTQHDCDIVAERINSMHRKILGYATAQELFTEQLALLSNPA